MSACRRHYPGRTDGTDSLVPFQRRRPSPHYSWVSSCIISFEACSAFTRVTTCRLAESPCATLYIGGSGDFVASTAAPIATGWSDPVPGRFISRCGPAPFTAHCKGLITEVTAEPFSVMQRKAAPSGGLVFVATWWVRTDGYFMLLSFDSSAMVALSSKIPAATTYGVPLALKR